MRLNNLKKLLPVVLLYGIFKQAFSYLDPGSGSIIIQVLIAVIAGSAATLYMFKDRILVMLGRKKKSSLDDDDDPTDDSNPTTSA